MEEVVPHESGIRHQVLDLELQQLCGRLLFVQEVQRVHLLQHFILHRLAPDYLDGIGPFTTDAPQQEELFGAEKSENLRL